MLTLEGHSNMWAVAVDALGGSGFTVFVCVSFLRAFGTDSCVGGASFGVVGIVVTFEALGYREVFLFFYLVWRDYDAEGFYPLLK